MRFYFHLILALLFFSLQQLPASAGPDGRDEAKPRYIFLFIGDGMGQGQCRAAEAALGRELAINHMPVSGTTDTHNVEGKVTDSAAAGTAIACGARTKNGMLGQAPDGKALESAAARAKKAGMKVGIITSVPLDHATPAAFYAHANSRNSYADIARQLAESGFDFFAGEPLLAAARGNTEALVRIKEHGYRLLDDPAGLDDKYEGKVCICKKFKRTLARDEKDNFTLARLTAAAISSLENENGFFIMVEGGAIDWACHQNDGALAVRDIEEFDFAVRAALDFITGRPGQGLVVVTADHETGGLAVTADRGAGVLPEVEWTDTGHTRTPVGCWAWGPGSERVDGSMANTNTFHALRDAALLQTYGLGVQEDGEGRRALLWATAPGDAFRIEYSDRLDLPDWRPLGVATAATDSVFLGDTNDWPQAQRFYRAVALP